LGVIAGLVLLAGLPAAAYADTPTAKPVAQPVADTPQTETLITAQQMNSDQATGIVTAIGHVEIARGGYILHADKVTYNQKTGIMRAEGHVAMLTPEGDVEFADHEEITGDMKQAFAQNMGILFPDSSRMTARTSQRYDGRYLVGDKGTYTSCNVCKENPDNPPLWQLQAQQIVHDNVEHDIYYHDATLDFAGVPVGYTPYLSGPDPTVDRRQGLLTATPGYSPNIGEFIRIPYYFDIAPNIDAVLSPTFSTVDTAQFGGEYRERFERGNLQLDGTFTHADLISDTGTDEGEQWRGNLSGKFVYDIDNVWRAGADINFTSDDSYLLRYQISSADELINRLYLEGFQGRDYAAVNSYYFEDIIPGPQPVQPLVLPEASFNALGEPGKTFGGRWSLDGDLLVTTRDNSGMSVSQQGPDTRRLSLDTGWERQFISNTGLVSTLSGLLRDDNYWADNVVDPSGDGQVYNNVTIFRPFAQANLIERYPLGRQGDGYQELFEPIVAFTAAPTVKPQADQPIEDSLDVEFDETNLFSPNRFTGTDLIEGGSRVTYGMRNAITGDGGARIDMFGGESYTFNVNQDFPGESGLHDNTSDYVGRIDFVPASWFSLNYGARLDHETFNPQRQDANLSVGVPLFRPWMRYISAFQTETTGIVDQVKETTIGFDSHFAKYWGIHADYTQAFSPDPGPRSADVGFSYIDECFIFGVMVSQTETNRVDLNSGTSVMFHLYLRNIGGVHTDSSSGTAANFATQYRQY
jgi:LPS-assembly protein